MTRIQELIARQRAENEPPAAAEPEPEKPMRNERLDRLIAQARAHIENNWQDVDVILGGEIVTVSIGELWPDDWIRLSRHNPAQNPADKPYGYDRSAVARAYLADRLKLNGEPTDADTWQAVWDLLEGDDHTNVEAVMWWEHIGEPQEQLRQARAERVTSEGDAAD